jgi:dTDP-4-amino-4,6-dideoxygalactose transaminase
VNSRLDELQAAILRVKLRHLDRQTARRQVIAAAYDAALVDGPIAPPQRRAGASSVFHLYVVRVTQRAVLQERLRGMGIGTAVHYPVPVHLQPAYAGRVALGPAGCQATVVAAEEVLSLPIFPEMTDSQVSQVCEALSGLRLGWG